MEVRRLREEDFPSAVLSIIESYSPARRSRETIPSPWATR